MKTRETTTLYRPTLTLNEVSFLKDELKRTKAALHDSQLSVDKFRNVLRKYLNDRATLKSQNLEYHRKVSGERDVYKSKFIKLQDEMNEMRQEMCTMECKLKTRTHQLQRSIKSNAKNTVKLSMMFLKMKATKQTIDVKRGEFEKMCNELILYMKEQSDLMKFVTENMMQHDDGESTNPHILEFLKRFSWLLFENSKLRFKVITHVCANERAPTVPQCCEDKNIMLKNLEEASQILQKINHFQKMNCKPCPSSLSLNGSKSTIFERCDEFYTQSSSKLKRTQSASSISWF